MRRALSLFIVIFSIWCTSLLANQTIWDPMVSQELKKLGIWAWEEPSTGYAYRVGKDFSFDSRGTVVTPSPYGFVHRYQITRLSVMTIR